MDSWRDQVLTLTELGACLERINEGLRRLNATAVYNTSHLQPTLFELRKAARELLRHLERLPESE